MLATYGLQEEVVSLLLSRGADVNAVAHREQLTALHALAVGICRDYEVQQQPLDLRGEAAAAVLLGLNDYALSAGVYTRSNSTAVSPLLREQQLEDILDARVPLVSRLPSDLLLFPQQLLLRLTRAFNILQLLLAAPCHSSTLSQLTRSGFSAEQLLQRLWQQLLDRRALLQQRSEVRLAALSQTQRKEIEGGWEEAGQLVFRLRELLTIAQDVAKTHREERRRRGEKREGPPDEGVAAEESEREDEDETPRPEDVAYRQRKELERQAPWLFYEEKYRQQQQRAAEAAERGKKEAAAAKTKAEGKAEAAAEAKEKAAPAGAAAEKAAAAAGPPPKTAPLPPGKVKSEATGAAKVEKLGEKLPPAPQDGSAASASASAAGTPAPKLPSKPSPAPAAAAEAAVEEKKGAVPPAKKPPAKGPPVKLKGPPLPLKKG